MRERIERRRARERREQHPAAGSGMSTLGRGVREIRPGQHLTLVASAGAATAPARRRPRPRALERIGPHPDRIAAWAVVMGVALVVAALVSH